MEEPSLDQSHEHMDLRGTLFIVFTIAVIILIIWFTVYAIFVSRS
jgi:hypothetical protein